jgi:tRNA wybutosine-synthesizing protein 1
MEQQVLTDNKPTVIYYRPWENIKETKENGRTVLRLPQKVIDSLINKQYGVFGHSGVQICGWTKNSLREKGVCYKQKFYGIDCHSCMEFSPAVMWCQENCSFCWRPMEFMKNIEIKNDEVDDPKEIIDNLIIQRKKLLSGFGGYLNINKKKLADAQTPSHFAISLSGEPTMYPKLNAMVQYLKSLSKTKSIFIVTNAQIPEYFEKLQLEPQSLPTQLYISLQAPTEEIFKKINMSLYSDGWQRLQKSLKISSTLSTRKVIRFTHLKGINDSLVLLPEYKKLIELGKPDFIEMKAYMHIGMSRERHSRNQMPEYVEVVQFAKELANYLGNYDLVDIAPNSRICLLRRKDSPYPSFIDVFEHN